MGFVVIGLSQDGNVRAVHDTLAAAGIAAERLNIIDSTDIDLIEGSSLVGTDLITSDGGTAVPGLNSTSITVHPDDSLVAKLSDLNIPDSEIENYLEALSKGRSVVAYTATGETVDKVMATFRTAGLLNVRQF
jgi:rhodanese-related sulfurtransferase